MRARFFHITVSLLLHHHHRSSSSYCYIFFLSTQSTSVRARARDSIHKNASYTLCACFVFGLFLICNRSFFLSISRSRSCDVFYCIYLRVFLNNSFYCLLLSGLASNRMAIKLYMYERWFFGCAFVSLFVNAI